MEKNTAAQQTAYRTLEEAAKEVQEWTAILESRIINARKWGISWTEIGALMGISKQTAHARYGKLVAAPEAADDVQGPSVTPSIFSDEPAPAKAKTTSKKSDTKAPAKVQETPAAGEFRERRPMWKLESAGMIDGVAQPGTGKGPHQCPACGSNNHKTGQPNTIAAFFLCKPTKYDPQDISDHITNYVARFTRS